MADTTVTFNNNGQVSVVNTIWYLPIKKLDPAAKLPTRGSKEAAGWDLYANSYEDFNTNEDWVLNIPPHATVKIGTGVAIALPKNTFGGIYPRSGMATKQGLAPANKVGVIDSDYRGELIVALHNHSDYMQILHRGDRIAQLIVQEYVSVEIDEVEELDDTERGTGGFGSTGQ